MCRLCCKAQNAWYNKSMKVAVILNCGEQIKRKINADKVVCCDGGYTVCPVEPDVILGDFDSLQKPEDTDALVVQHNPHKNASDGELAIYFAKEELGADEIVLYGVTGGRIDHVLCNLAVMRLAKSLGMKVKAEEDGLDVYYAEGEFDMPSQKGEIISILPYGQSAIVTDSKNLEYPLDELMLTSNDSRGLSNVSLGGRVHINVKVGRVFVFRYIKR